jgi:hypothetical protein
VVQDWFRSNPLNLGVPSDGAAEVSLGKQQSALGHRPERKFFARQFIRGQIERGNKYERSRVKVWQQIGE